MAINTTLGHLVQLTPALGRLTAIHKPAQLVYHIVKLVKLIQPELKHYEEKRVELIKKYGSEREPTPEEATRLGPERITEVTDSEKIKQFYEEHNNLIAVQVELAWSPIKVLALVEANVSAGDILAMEPILSFEGLDDATTP